MKGSKTYDDLSKDSWRGWKWNSIADAATLWRKLPPSEKSRQLSTKTVLYLVGPEDHDRKRALSRGFANHNLIAVDLCENRVQEVRNDGGLAICGSLQQVIMNWPHDWMIDVVDGDFCSGLVNDVGELPNCLFLSRGIHGNTVLSINLMRGRDAHSNSIRETIRDFIEPIFLEAVVDESNKYHDIVKHRASNWLMLCCNFWQQVQNLNNNVPELRDSMDRLGTFMSAAFIRDLFGEFRPKINSYRSKTSGQWFDSVVHRWAFQVMDQDGVAKSSWTDHRESVSEKLSDDCARIDGIRAKIAALRAVRTKFIKRQEALK